MYPGMFIAGVMGLTGVLAGTFGAHTLKGVVTESGLQAFETGVRYHLLHAVAALALAFCPLVRNNAWLRRAGWFWVVGVTVFSGSLYALAITDQRWFGWITPFGGVALLAGWCCIGIAAIGSPRAYLDSHEES